ncbi:hypothetical protein FJT64_017770 [Amphibalanus amphitrite]|uniref:Uncharacterized protein n=1 Tax=Amphibalanus amphitrite TaxID=1232801 RepID=A0A6A4WZJ1_AMPAM|nr:hypothetical protein FJT64_017770 [Amphibalanus amphitrite]
MAAENPAAAAKKLQAVGQETLAEDSQDSLARYNTIMVTVILAIFSLCVMVTTEGAMQELRAGDFFCKLDGTLTCQNYTVRCVGEGFINCDGPSSTRGRDDAGHHSMPIKKKAESDDKPDGGEGEKKKTLLRQLDSLRTQLVDNDNETFTANSSTSKALDVLEAELQRPDDSEGTSCTVARMVCSELPPLSSCTGTSAGKCHEKQPMTREGMMVALLVPITITTIGIMIYVLFWKRVGSQVDVEQPSAERAGAAKKAEAGASQPAA